MTLLILVPLTILTLFSHKFFCFSMVFSLPLIWRDSRFLLNSFSTNVPLLYPLKTSENRRLKMVENGLVSLNYYLPFLAMAVEYSDQSYHLLKIFFYPLFLIIILLCSSVGYIGTAFDGSIAFFSHLVLGKGVGFLGIGFSFVV